MLSPRLEPSFDPFSQNITIFDSNGSPIILSILDVNNYAEYAIEICINYSSQIGASMILLVVILLTTRKEKRQSPVFILNALSLFINTIRNILQCLYFTGEFYSFYAQVASDFSKVPRSEYDISVAGVVLSFLLLVCIEASLILQVRAVCATLNDRYRYPLMAFVIVTALSSIGFRLALSIENARAIVALTDFLVDYEWLALAALWSSVASVCVFSLIFVSKLGVALYQRKKLGIRQFGPMQIIFIMGCQTLVVPAIFSILQFVCHVPELGSQVLTVTAIFLPLSSMWATAALGDSSSLAGAPSTGSKRRRFLGSNFSGTSARLFQKRASPLSFAAGVTTTKISKASEDTSRSTNTIMEKDLERGDMAIHVARSFDILTERRD